MREGRLELPRPLGHRIVVRCRSSASDLLSTSLHSIETVGSLAWILQPSAWLNALAGPFFVRPNIFSPLPFAMALTLMGHPDAQQPALATDAVARQLLGAGEHHVDRDERTEDVLALTGRELRPLRPCCSSRSWRAQDQCVPVPPGTETEHAARYGHLIDT